MHTPEPVIRATCRRPALSLFTAALGALALAGCGGPAGERAPADLLIAGGTVFIGDSSAPQVADLVVRDDQIAYVGPDGSAIYSAHRTINADGLVVAPGFIDPHTHPYTYIRSDDPKDRRNAPWLFQGVTTIFIGVDGGGSPDIADNSAGFEENGVGTNLGQYVGFGAVRRRVLGQQANAPDEDELDQMRTLVADAMCEGAFGLSTGLFYAPQSFADTDEVIALAREAAIRGGLYDTHQRDESSYSTGLLGSVSEALEIGRRAGIPVHFAHIKALGTDVHGQADKVIALIDQARAEGQRVTADQYPWLASGSNLGSALLPRWSVEGGRSAFLQRMQDADSNARIRREMTENLQRRGGAESLLLTARGWPWAGQTLGAVAKEWGVGPEEAALRILAAGDDAPAGAQPAGRVASFNMDRGDVDLFMRQPWVVTSSDGSDGHPRQYASFPEKYARFVREDNVIELGDFIHRSTGMTADILGLQDRGTLRAGHYADVVVFDPDRYAPRADYLDSRQLSEGVQYLLVNGVLAIDAGQATDALAGRVLRHRPTQGCP